MLLAIFLSNYLRELICLSSQHVDFLLFCVAKVLEFLGTGLVGLQQVEELLVSEGLARLHLQRLAGRVQILFEPVIEVHQHVFVIDVAHAVLTQAGRGSGFGCFLFGCGRPFCSPANLGLWGL